MVVPQEIRPSHHMNKLVNMTSQDNYVSLVGDQPDGSGGGGTNKGTAVIFGDGNKHIWTEVKEEKDLWDYFDTSETSPVDNDTSREVFASDDKSTLKADPMTGSVLETAFDSQVEPGSSCPAEENEDESDYSVVSDSEDSTLPDESNNAPDITKRVIFLSRKGKNQTAGSTPNKNCASGAKLPRSGQALRARWMDVTKDIRTANGFFGNYHLSHKRLRHLSSFPFNKNGRHFSCPHCEGTYASRAGTVRHVMHVHYPFVCKWLCPYHDQDGHRCRRRFKRIDDLKTHISARHGMCSKDLPAASLELTYDYNDGYIPPKNVGITSPFQFAEQVAEDSSLYTCYMSGSSGPLPVVSRELCPEQVILVPCADFESGNWSFPGISGTGDDTNQQALNGTPQKSTNLQVQRERTNSTETSGKDSGSSLSGNPSESPNLMQHVSTDSPMFSVIPAQRDKTETSKLVTPTDSTVPPVTKKPRILSPAICTTPITGINGEQVSGILETLQNSVSALNIAVGEAEQSSDCPRLEALSQSVHKQVASLKRLTGGALDLMGQTGDVLRQVTRSTALAHQRSQIRKDLEAEHMATMLALRAERDHLQEENETLKNEMLALRAEMASVSMAYISPASGPASISDTSNRSGTCSVCVLYRECCLDLAAKGASGQQDFPNYATSRFEALGRRLPHGESVSLFAEYSNRVIAITTRYMQRPSSPGHIPMA